MKKLGILTVGNQQQFTGNRANFRAITRKGKELGWEVVVVPAECIQHHIFQNGLKAYKWDVFKQEWVTVFTTMPDFFYNRIPYRDLEARQVVKNAKRVLTDREIPWFNPSFFSKDMLYEILNRSAKCRTYLPRTEMFQPQILSQWLQEEDQFYLKPVQGSLGEGIIKVTREDNYYCAEQQQAGKKVMLGIFTPYELQDHLNTLIGKKRFVLQKAIDLQRIGNSVYDLRALLQRGGKGEWQVTGIGARVSAENGITTHVPNGGHIENIHIALEQSFGRDSEEVYQNAESAAIQLAEEISRNHSGLIGEMSMDLGTDKDGNIWFFEANAKPMKFDEPEIRKRSLTKLFEFGEFLISARTDVHQ